MDKYDLEKLILAFDKDLYEEIEALITNKEVEMMFAIVRRAPVQLLSLIDKFQLDINMKNTSGETLLIASIQMGRLDFIDALLNMGCQVNSLNRHGETALDLAWQSEEIATKLIKYGAKQTKLIDPLSIFNLACEPRDLHILNNTDLKMIDNNGWTLLMLSARRNWINCVKRLIELGVDVNQRGWHGQTALIVACDYSNYPIVKELIQSNADIDIQDDDNWTALMYACKNQYNTNLVTHLFEYGAKLELKNNEKQTARDIAEQHGHINTVEVLC